MALPITRQILANGTDATLLYVIYTVLGNRLSCIGDVIVNILHTIVYTVMALVGIADAALFIYAQVLTATQNSKNPTVVSTSDWYRKIHMAYTSLYCAVALEMFACAFFLIRKFGAIGIKSQVSWPRKELSWYHFG